LGGLAAVIFSYFNFFHLIWWPLAIILESVVQNQWLGGIVGMITFHNKWLFGSHIFLFTTMFFYFYLSFGRKIKTKESLAFNKKQLKLLIKNLNIPLISLKYHENNLFSHGDLKFHKNLYPINYLYYDVQLILKNFSIIHNKSHNVRIIKSNGVSFGHQYFQSKKILTALFNWSYGVQWLWGTSFFYFGVNENKQLMYFPLKKIYNLFIVDKKQQWPIEYNNKYLK
jgi:hypothetical protein